MVCQEEDSGGMEGSEIFDKERLKIRYKSTDNIRMVKIEMNRPLSIYTTMIFLFNLYNK